MFSQIFKSAFDDVGLLS